MSDFLDVRTSAMVDLESGDPGVAIVFGNQYAYLATPDAMDHGLDLITSAIASKFDALIVGWAVERLKMSANEIDSMMKFARTAQAPDIGIEAALKRDREREQGRKYIEMGIEHISLAYRSDVEALISQYLLSELNYSEGTAQQVVQELREKSKAAASTVVDDRADDDSYEGDRP
jgi:hypothetical protein